MPTIAIHDALHQRVATVAAQRGESVAALVEEAIKAYLEELTDGQAIQEARGAVAHGEDDVLDDRQELAALADAAAEEYVERGGEPLNAEGIRQLLGRRADEWPRGEA